MSILLGLVSAFFYGATDFVARSSSRRLGVLTTMLWAQASAALLTSLALLIASPSQRVTLEMAAFLVSSDLLILGATGLLYYALSVGRLSVVAPVGATYGGVTAMLSIASGETLAPVPGIGLVVLLVGVVLVARPQKQTTEAKHGHGLIPATAAATLYGVGFWLQGSYVVPKVGSLVTVWSYYVLGTVLLGGLALSRASLVRPSNARDVILAIGTGLLAVAAYLALAIGQHMGSVAVVTMLSSLASAFAVIFAALILKERIAASGWIGLGGIIGGLMLLHV